MAGSAIRPEALAAGLAIAVGAYIWYQKVESHCEDFTDLWTEDGPIHIKNGPKEEAFESAMLKLRSVDAANAEKDYDRTKLAYYVAYDVAPKCDWEEIAKGDNEKGKQVWAGFLAIADYTWGKMYPPEEKAG